MTTLIVLGHLHVTLCSLVMALTVMGSFRANAEVKAAPAERSDASFPAYPVKVTANGRYLVDRNNIPFLIVGDSQQGLMYRLSEEQAESYFADRQARGFNAAGWIDVSCTGRDYPANPEGSTYDGIRPFIGFVPGGTDSQHYDLTKPNEA